MWPPAAPVTPEQLESPSLWPDDPSYGYDIGGQGASCIDDHGGRCWTNATGGQWNFWSWVPPQALALSSFRRAQAPLGAGAWTDMAWQYTTGDRRVVIAVLDSGIKWDERDLVNQYALNAAELRAAALPAACLPAAPPGHVGDPVDIDGDGVLTMADYTAGKAPEDAADIEAALDAAGNHNGVADPGDLIVLCTNGVDDDGNGYKDDIAGWDFLHGDNDPQDDTRFGHGTGEAKDSTAEGNNGRGGIGQCPRCRVLPVRVGDSFVTDATHYAEGVVFAVDSGASVVQEALGTLNNPTLARRAQRYAYDHGVLIVASAADENSRHHNFPGTNNHTLYVHAVTIEGGEAQTARSYTVYNNCTNYGAQLALSVPGESCSSEATGVTAGVAGLVYAAAMAPDRPGGPLDPPLRAAEAMQLLTTMADDIDVPESQPGNPHYDPTLYPSGPGWDQRFGYGRLNAYRAVKAVRDGRIPPEASFVVPNWFRYYDPAQTPAITISGRVSAPRAASFDYVLEWAPGIEPTDAEFHTLAAATDQTSAVGGALATWDISGVVVDNPGELENRYTVTLRLRVTAHYGEPVGDVEGVARRAIAIHHDPDLLPGFPLALGAAAGDEGFQAASGEGSPKLVDLDGKPGLEIVFADSDGLLHALRSDGSELSGYPVRLGVLRGLDPAAPGDPGAVLGSHGYASGAVRTDDVGPSVILSVPAIGDLDGDGGPDIVVGTMEGGVWAVDGATGTPLAGWPIALPDVPSGDTLRGGPTRPGSAIQRGVIAAPVLADLDDDGKLEVIVAALDGRVYVLRRDGGMQPGFPVTISAPSLYTDPTEALPARIVTAPAVGDADGDGQLDIAVGSNQTGDMRMLGAAHVIHGDGTLHEGGAWLAGWPVTMFSIDVLPFVGEGIVSSPAMADLDGDGVAEVAFAGTGGAPALLAGGVPAAGEHPAPLVGLQTGAEGPGAMLPFGINLPLLNVFVSGTFTDLDGDGVVDYVTGGAGPSLIASQDGYQNVPHAHSFGAWRTSDGAPLYGFPQRIEDYQFFTEPTSADIDDDGYPEVLEGSGGYYLHAWNACGVEPKGWPKFTDGWIASSPAVGDLDGDGEVEVVVATRDGYLFAWHTTGSADGAAPWPEYRHDSHNTGNFDALLPRGGGVTVATAPIDCAPLMPTDGGMPDAGLVDAGQPDGGALDAGLPDAGVLDGGTSDAGAPAYVSLHGGAGCSCRVAGPGVPVDGGSPGGLPAVLFLASVFTWRIRRKLL